MKRVYWLLIAAVPVVLWWLSQGGSQQEAQPAPAAPPEPEAEPPAKTEAPAEVAKDLPTSSNGAFHKAAPEAAPETVANEPEQVEQAADLAPPLAPQLEVVPEPEPVPVAEPAVTVESSPAAAPEGEKIQLFDSKERACEAWLVDITSAQAQVTCSESLADKEKVRLVLPFGEEAITINAQLQGGEQGLLRFKIMTMKAGQKKRFEDYLSQRLGL
ncbi:MAG: hypothetical protein U0931_17260 [Vulcanimicrobiota bacterium]